MNTRARRPPRGQGTVELAVGLLVFVTILVFGIHFAEVNYLTLRVQQANHYALFNATGQRTHIAITDPGPLAEVPGNTALRGNTLFNDFDGARAKATTVTQVFTRASGFNLACTAENSVSYWPTQAKVQSVFWNQGGMKCSASATMGIFNFPRTFLDGNWNFKDRHYAGAQESYTVCATARPSGGQCGDFGLLVGDWSLVGANESRSHDLFGGGNPAYANAVQTAFAGGNCGPAIALSQFATGTSADDACAFAFSYQGVEANYLQSIGSAEGGSPTEWNTGGAEATNNRPLDDVTFLGAPATRRNF